MTNLLIKLFLKDKDASTPHGREAYGRVAGIVGIACNLLFNCFTNICCGLKEISPECSLKGLIMKLKL